MPAPNRFNMLNFKMHCILLVLVCVEFLLFMPRTRERGAMYEMQCSAVVAASRHFRHKLLSFRLISVVCCRRVFSGVRSLSVSTLPHVGTGTGTFVFIRSLNGVAAYTWSDFTNFTSKSIHTLHANASTTATRRNFTFSLVPWSVSIFHPFSLTFAWAIVRSSLF